MTTTNEVFRNSYTATAGQTVFPYTFKAFARSDNTGELQVYKNGTLLVEGAGASEYTVSGLGNAGGGNVTLNTGAALNDAIVIIPDPDFIQSTTYVEGDKFPSAVTENAFDRTVIRDLAIKEELSRKVGVGAGSSTSITFPSYSAGKLLAWSASVDGTIVVSTKTLSAVEAAVDAVAGLSSGSGVLVSSNDAAVGFLNGKLVAGTNIGFTENNDGSNETLTLAVNNARLNDIAANLSATSGTVEKTAANTFGTYTVTSFAKTLLDDADAATARTTLGVATPIFTKSFVSANQTITPGGTLTLAHGMAEKPKIIEVVLICQTAEYGYAIGDEVFINSRADDGGSGSLSGGVNVWVDDTTNIKCQYGSTSNMFVVNRRSATAGVSVQLTDGNWRLQIRAYA